MSDDSGEYLVSASGMIDAALAGDTDVTEIVIRERTIGEGAGSLTDLARALRDEAERYDRLLEDGWHLVEPVSGGSGRCVVKALEQRSHEMGHVGRSWDPEKGLDGVMEGATSLAEAASALRQAAGAYEERARGGWRLADTVRDGQVSLSRRG